MVVESNCVHMLAALADNAANVTTRELRSRIWTWTIFLFMVCLLSPDFLALDPSSYPNDPTTICRPHPDKPMRNLTKTTTISTNYPACRSYAQRWRPHAEHHPLVTRHETSH